MQKRTFEPRDLEDRLSHTVLLITNSSQVINGLIFFYLFIACTFYLFSHYFFTTVYNPAIAAIPTKPLYYYIIT